MWLIFTGFLCAAYAINIPKGYNQELLVLGLIYAYFSLFMLFCYVPTTIVTKPWNACIKQIRNLLYNNMGSRTRTIAYGCLVSAIIIATVFSFPEKEESPRIRRLISVFGLFIFLAITWAASKVSASTSWKEMAIFIVFIMVAP
jgi:CNT family concentrative nucleoside transporter